MERFSISGGDGQRLTVTRWDAAPPVKAVVQIAHGAAEHLGRYDRLARFLTKEGYAVLGADHRGHGMNAEPFGLGNFGRGGFAGIIDDMRQVTEVARAGFHRTPVILLGHSFGSFAAQMYLLKHGAIIDGLVLSGTAAVDLLLAGADLGGGLSSANANFEPARTPFDWLSRDEREVDAYMADPLCGFDVDPLSLASMSRAVAEISSRYNLALAAERNIPLYIISGGSDPIVGPMQCFSEALAHRYTSAGLRVQHRVYPGGRHEMFNETNRDEVLGDLILWLDTHF